MRGEATALVHDEGVGPRFCSNREGLCGGVNEAGRMSHTQLQRTTHEHHSATQVPDSFQEVWVSVA